MTNLTAPLWYLTKDGDKSLLHAYEQHYSCYQYRDGRTRTQCVGPGQVIALRTLNADAFFVWRHFLDKSGQTGVNNAIFINHSSHTASELIRQACNVAHFVWPHRRLYTYVNPSKIRSTNPGYCYLAAGWRKCGSTKRGLLILEYKETLYEENTANGQESRQSQAI